MISKIDKDKPLPSRFIQTLGMINNDYVVLEQLGDDGRIHRNFVTLAEAAEHEERVINWGKSLQSGSLVKKMSMIKSQRAKSASKGSTNRVASNSIKSQDPVKSSL